MGGCGASNCCRPQLGLPTACRWRSPAFALWVHAVLGFDRTRLPIDSTAFSTALFIAVRHRYTRVQLRALALAATVLGRGCR
jgi:hypothetical protein